MFAPRCQRLASSPGGVTRTLDISASFDQTKVGRGMRRWARGAGDRSAFRVPRAELVGIGGLGTHTAARLQSARGFCLWRQPNASQHRPQIEFAIRRRQRKGSVRVHRGLRREVEHMIPTPNGPSRLVPLSVSFSFRRIQRIQVGRHWLCRCSEPIAGRARSTPVGLSRETPTRRSEKHYNDDMLVRN